MEKEELRKAIGIVIVAAAAVVAMPRSHAASDDEAIAIQRATPVDRTGKRKVGIASYYHSMFNGRKMADGQPFDPNGINAASKSLPLGTVALVTNLENNRTAIVKIQDRGPYSGDRIVDLSPRIAQELGMAHQGLAKVEVAPLAVPLPDGSVRAGEGARHENLRVATDL